MASKSKKELMDKYLKPKKQTASSDRRVSRIAAVVDNDLVAYERQAMHFDRSSDEDKFDPENLPVFVETAESRLLDEAEKQQALESLHRLRAKPAEARSVSGRWVPVDGALGKRGPAADESSEAESSSSEAEPKPRRRHDMSDSDIEVDSEERNQQKQEQELAFKQTLEKALGIDPGEHRDSESAASAERREPQAGAEDLMAQVGARLTSSKK